MAKVRREDPPLPVYVLADGVWHEGVVTAWVREAGDADWRASVAWSEVRDYGFRGTRLGSVPAERLRPRPG